MSIVIAHRTVTGVYLCHEGVHWYWGPRDQAEMYSIETAKKLVRSFPAWEDILGVSCDDAKIEIDRTPVTVAPPNRNHHGTV
jgi:hypothetical protein